MHSFGANLSFLQVSGETALFGNALDGSAPVYHKGKSRENRHQKLTPLKKSVLADRSVRKQMSVDERTRFIETNGPRKDRR